jgi:prepilin-type N-terminal cleavage/methylation domain-containing protein
MRRPNAFTIIELLVVITVISLLVSLLIPNLSKARKVAMITQCGAIMRQHGIGMNAYRNDYKFYYPLFGGTPYTDYYGRYCNVWDASQFDATVFNAYGVYINLPNDGASQTPTTSLSKMKYCPVVNWNVFGAYTFENASTTPYWNGSFLGYELYPGHILGPDSTWGMFDTIERREDNKELLMTDQLAISDEVVGGQAHYVGGSNFNNTQTSTVYMWFNPHVDRSCTALRQGSANHLAADGHVANLDITQGATPPYVGYYNWGPVNAIVAYYTEYYYAGSVNTNNANSSSNGYYAQIP